MVRFAEWLVLDSFVDRLEREVLLEQAALETLDMVVSVLRENEEYPASVIGAGYGMAQSNIRAARERKLQDDLEALKFPDSDEDAEPIKGSEVQDDSDAEPATPQESGRIDPTSNEKKILRRISSALKTIRAGGIRDRFRKVEEIKKIRKEVEDTNAADDALSVQNPRDPQDAIPILVSLGYLSKGVAEKIGYRLSRRLADDKKKDLGGFLTSKAKDSIKKMRSSASDKLMEKIVAASQEEGNDPPEGGFPTDSDTEKADDDFVKATNRLLGGRFRRLARSNQTSMGKDRTGHRLTEPDELAADMAVGLLAHFAKRKWKGGKLQPWNSNDELLKQDSGWLLPYLMTTAKNLPKKMAQNMSSQLAPPPRTRNSSIAKKTKKAEVINSDFKSGNLGFYIAYMKKAAENPFDRRSPDEQIIQPREQDDRVRLSIMQDIEKVINFTRMSSEDISIDPSGDDETLRSRVRTTLSTYLYRVLPTNLSRVIHASALAKNDGEESSMDDILSAHVDAGDDEPDLDDHQGIDSMSNSSPDEDRTAPLLGLLSRAIDEIAAMVPEGPIQAFALCVKFNLKCDIRIKPSKMKSGQTTTTVASLRVSRDAQLNIPRDFNYNTIGTNCTNALGKIGLTDPVVAQRWGIIPGTPGKASGLTPVSKSYVHEYLKGNPRKGTPGALTMLCNKLKAMVGRVPAVQD
jgi:hypothetical protein